MMHCNARIANNAPCSGVAERNQENQGLQVKSELRVRNLIKKHKPSSYPDRSMRTQYQLSKALIVESMEG